MSDSNGPAPDFTAFITELIPSRVDLDLVCIPLLDEQSRRVIEAQRNT